MLNIIESPGVRDHGRKKESGNEFSFVGCLSFCFHLTDRMRLPERTAVFSFLYP
jgi:hypothetical protein